MTAPGYRHDLAPVVASAQRVAGLLAARHRGDAEGARQLMDGFDGEQDLARGALLVAELSLGLLQRESGQSLDQCVHDLCLHLEQALTAPPH
ncbi:hypothetical protein [Nocardioides sp.]|uniref:hypothetical protein n=1 Tax=Nocardioides sp. TaxID=35761 RepID=UPI003513521F